MQGRNLVDDEEPDDDFNENEQGWAENVGEEGEKEGAEDEAQTEDEGQAGDVEEVEHKAEDKGEAGAPRYHKRHQEEVVDNWCLKKMQHKIRPIMRHNWW